MYTGSSCRIALGQKSTLILMVCLTIFCVPTTSAQTDDSDNFSLSLGIFITDRDSATRLDTQAAGTGTPVDLERDFGLDTSDTVFRVDGYYRFNEKHRIDFSAFDLSRNATKQIDRDINWKSTVFPINITVEGDFDVTIYKVAYTWSFRRREKGYLGLTAGLYIADIGTSLSAQSIGAREVADVTAPLPVIGLRGEYNISEKWTVRASGEIFAIEYGDFDGSLFDFYAGVDYQLFDRMALGLGVNSVRMDIGITKDDLNGDLDWQYSGALLYFKFDY